MNNQQLYLAIGLPTLVVLTSLVTNLVAISSIKDSIREIRTEVNGIHQELIDIRKDMAAMHLALSKEIGDLRTELTRDFVRKQ